jgi:hypothetical protein
LFLKYTLLNSENAFENLETPTQYPSIAKGNADGIGIGAKIYFDFIKLLNKSN